jgi:hypothetical protein
LAECLELQIADLPLRSGVLQQKKLGLIENLLWLRLAQVAYVLEGIRIDLVAPNMRIVNTQPMLF